MALDVRIPCGPCLYCKVTKEHLDEHKTKNDAGASFG